MIDPQAKRNIRRGARAVVMLRRPERNGGGGRDPYVEAWNAGIEVGMYLGLDICTDPKAIMHVYEVAQRYVDIYGHVIRLQIDRDHENAAQLVRQVAV